ncbi:MAG: hypothetical protein WCI71_04770, partial [Bacteroidota bacterium]
MRSLIVALLTLIFVQITYAQKECKALIDSLYAELPVLKDDTNKVRLLATICYELRNINPREGLVPGMEALSLSEQLNYEYGKGISHYSLVLIYHFLSRLPESMDHALRAQQNLENMGEK